ncbi:MAG TPA: hypothetical protein VFC90_03580 [Planctomycetota bacterium]|nr:hypothetical protein [Planctomycetota bacterium]
MPKKAPFKPCQELTPADFDQFPIWGFDLARAESDPKADETWVSPVQFKNVPKFSDGLFVGAEIAAADGSPVPGAVCLRFGNGKPQVEGLAILGPQYCFLFLDGKKVGEETKRALKKSHRPSTKWFPITFRAAIKCGSKQVTISGSAE